MSERASERGERGNEGESERVSERERGERRQGCPVAPQNVCSLSRMS